MTEDAKGETRRITASDGHELACWVAPARGTRKGGLVVLQEIFGVTDQLKGVAVRYAAQGFEVAVPALFDRHTRDAVIPFDDAPRGRAIMDALDDDDTLRDVSAAVDAIRAGGKVGVIGFCWGGGLALRAAQVLDVEAAVSFYGTRLVRFLDRPLRAPFQGHFGRTDDHTPPALVAQVQEALPGAEIHMYDAGHAFANEARPNHVPEAAGLAHERTAEFLARHLG